MKKKNERNRIELEPLEVPSCQGKSPPQGRMKEREKADRQLPQVKTRRTGEGLRRGRLSFTEAGTVWTEGVHCEVRATVRCGRRQSQAPLSPASY